jgi:hypothetical protein
MKRKSLMNRLWDGAESLFYRLSKLWEWYCDNIIRRIIFVILVFGLTILETAWTKTFIFDPGANIFLCWLLTVFITALCILFGFYVIVGICVGLYALYAWIIGNE